MRADCEVRISGSQLMLSQLDLRSLSSNTSVDVIFSPLYSSAFSSSSVISIADLGLAGGNGVALEAAPVEELVDGVDMVIEYNGRRIECMCVRK